MGIAGDAYVSGRVSNDALASSQTSGIGILNWMARLIGISEIVCRNVLLGERREICGAFGFAEIHDDGAILPDVVVVVMVVATVIEEAARRALVHVDVMDTR